MGVWLGDGPNPNSRMDKQTDGGFAGACFFFLFFSNIPSCSAVSTLLKFEELMLAALGALNTVWKLKLSSNVALASEITTN